MPEKTVLLTIENNIAYVALNRAEKHNAINMNMFHQLDKVIKQLQKDKTLRAPTHTHVERSLRNYS